MIFGEKNTDKSHYEATNRKDYKNPHITSRPQLVKKRSNESTIFDGVKEQAAGSLPPLPKNIVPKEVRGGMAEVRHTSLNRKSGQRLETCKSQVDCSIFGAPFNSKTEYQNTTEKLRTSKPPPTYVGRSNFAAPCNPITGEPSKYRPANFEHVAGASGGHVSLDSIAKAQQRGVKF